MEVIKSIADCRLQIADLRFNEVARAAQALAPRVAPLFLIKMEQFLQSEI
jgi:hypothetical protein